MTQATTGATGSPATKRLRFGWYSYGWAAQVFETTVLAVFMSRYLPYVAAQAVGESGRLQVLGVPIAPGSLFTYIISLGSVLLIVLMPIVGAFADRTGRKRQLLFGFAYLGALACAAMVFVGTTDWVLGSILFMLAFLTYKCARVVYNSLLPDLAGPDERDTVSSIGWAAGYLGGGSLLALNFVASFLIDDSSVLARLSLCSAGVWWAAFMIVPAVILRKMPMSADTHAPQAGSAITAGFKELGDTLRHLRLYPWTLLFLLAYLVYYDGIATTTTLAADYGQNELKLRETTLLSAILLVQFASFGGALLLGKLSQRWGAKRVVAWSLVVWSVLITLAYFLEPGQPVQFYLLAIGISLVLGGSQALSRSMFASMIPTGKEAEYFSLFEISSSGTSALGPLLFGLVLQNTGSYRSAIFSLIAFFVIGLVLLLLVNVRKAITAAGNELPATLEQSR
ncbi:MAG TPA: MFS transporter [Kutzneria sp.]|jgi:UMF1 family MFS transporter